MANKKKNFIKKGNKFHKNSRNIKKSGKVSHNSEFDKKRKNFKFIKRSKEAEETQRRQKIVEDKYKHRNITETISEDDYNEEEEENPLEQLISTLKGGDEGKKLYTAIESSSDSEESAKSILESDLEDDQEIDYSSSEETAKSNLESDLEDDQAIDYSSSEELQYSTAGNSDKTKINPNIDISDNDEEEISENEVQNAYEEEESENDEFSDGESEDSSGSNIRESDDEKELDSEIENNEISPKQLENLDPFSLHFEYELSPEHVENLLSKPQICKKSLLVWPQLGNLQIEISKSSIKQSLVDKDTKIKQKLLGDTEMFAQEGKSPTLLKKVNVNNLNQLHVKNLIISNIIETFDTNISKAPMTSLQTEIFSILNNYQDLFYCHRNFTNAEEIRHVYCLHAINHMLKTRTKIIHHNAKIATMKNVEIIPESYRDQGLVRPKILIVLPFRDSAFRTINKFINLFFGVKSETAKQDGSVINYKRFQEEYTGDSIRFPKTTPKPLDYEQTFSGNTDDTFRIGLSFTKKCMKMYTEFYSSDILVASPLGLRMIIGASGDRERDYDFLNSIELLILDQAELFLAQNWDHLLHVLDHLHLQPQSVKNTDFSRVRPWCLNGLSRFYRQTLLFTSHELPEFRSLFNSKCSNYRGKLKSCNPINVGTIRNVITEVPQIFHKIEVTNIQSSFDSRFNYFINEILPQYKSPSMSHCMIYIPSYFDYVRLRNYFKSESINFVQICEYTKDSKMARARDMFFHSSAHFLLYSERAHFFRRTRIKGVRHLIMYQPPIWPNFYSEIINLMQNGYQNPRDGLELSMSVTILYTKYDMLQISSIIGSESANKMIKSGKTTHLFAMGD